MKLDDLNPTAWRELLRAKYVVQMHGGRGHDVERAALKLADAGTRLLGERRHVARVLRVAPVAGPGMEVVVGLSTGGMVKIDAVLSEWVPEVGDRVVVEVSERGTPEIAEVL